MASLVRRTMRNGKKSPYWTISYYDHLGTKKYVKGYTDKSRSQALANKLEDDKNALRRGETTPELVAEKRERAKGIEAHIEEYKLSLEAKNCSANHVGYVIADIKRFVAFSGVNQAAAIERKMVDQWLVTLTADSARTINRRVASLQQFLRHLKECGAVGKYVLYRYPKRPVKGTDTRLTRHLTTDEVRLLLTKTADPERRELYQFALLTGFRLNECRSMTPASLNFDQRTVTVKASDAKNKNRHQTIPMHPSLEAMLKRRCEGRQESDPLFNVPDKRFAAEILRKDCKAVGVDTKNVGFHGLRHTFITRLAENNIHPKLLQELARHSSLEVTLQHYAHFRQADERSAVASIDGIL